jgi:hypothetical protein
MNKPDIERKRQILIWTKEMDDYVDYYRDHRKSFTWISKQLGISRCAIIGRVHRKKKK